MTIFAYIMLALWLIQTLIHIKDETKSRELFYTENIIFSCFTTVMFVCYSFFASVVPIRIMLGAALIYCLIQTLATVDIISKKGDVFVYEMRQIILYVVTIVFCVIEIVMPVLAQYGLV